MSAENERLWSEGTWNLCLQRHIAACVPGTEQGRREVMGVSAQHSGVWTRGQELSQEFLGKNTDGLIVQDPDALWTSGEQCRKTELIN